MKTSILISVFALTLTGCWTFSETAYPVVQTSAATEGAKSVNLVGFEALLTEWEAVHGYRTVYVPGCYGRRHFHPGHIETQQTVDYVPLHRSTDMFLRRAQDSFEKAGFALAPTTSDYTVDLRFEGPFVGSNDALKKLAWNVFTVFFCDWGSTQWMAKLRIRETKTGRLVFHHDYVQPYETGVFGLIPLFGPASCDATDAAHMQSWCLAALTDRACADATAFIAARK